MHRKNRISPHGSQLGFGCLVVLAMLLTGCGLNGENGVQLAANQTFIWPLAPVPNFGALILDPANVIDFYSESVIETIFGGLVTTDHNLNVVPDMATWTISPDGRQYTFHLKQNLRFSDGSPITAQDFAYSIDRALDPNVCIPVFGPDCAGQPLASTYLIHIQGAAQRLQGKIPSLINTGLLVPDARTLVIKLDQPVAYFLEALTFPTAFPVEKSLVQKYGSDYQHHTDWTAHLNEGGASGPFMIQSYGKTQLTLAPNPYWYGPRQMTLKEIVRPYVADLGDAYVGYRQGKYDYGEVPSQEYLAARDQADFHEVAALATNFIGVNQDARPFDDLAVRQAFALALNKQLIADHVMSGTVYPTNHIVPEGMPGFYDGLTAPGTETRTITGDFDLAQKLISGYFARCGCHGQLTASITYAVEQEDGAAIITAMINMWDTVLSGPWGQVTVHPDPTSFQSLLQTRLPETVGNHPGAVQLWLEGWGADYPDPQDFLSLQFAAGSPNNAANYHDGVQDGQQFTAWQIMAQADVEQDPARRMNLYHQAEQQLVNDVAWIPFIQGKYIWRLKTYMQGFDPSALGLLSDQDWANVVVLAH